MHSQLASQLTLAPKNTSCGGSGLCAWVWKTTHGRGMPQTSPQYGLMAWFLRPLNGIFMQVEAFSLATMRLNQMRVAAVTWMGQLYEMESLGFLRRGGSYGKKKVWVQNVEAVAASTKEIAKNAVETMGGKISKGADDNCVQACLMFIAISREPVR